MVSNRYWALSSVDAGHQFLFVGIAQNNTGWAALCALLTEYSLANKPLPATAPPMENVFIIYDHEVKPIHLFLPNEMIGIRPGEANKLFSSAWRRKPEHLVIWQPLTFLDTEGYRLHKLLRAIDANTLVTKLDSVPLAQPNEYLRPESEYSSLQTIPKSYRIPGACSTPVRSVLKQACNSTAVLLWAQKRETSTCSANWQKAAACGAIAPAPPRAGARAQRVKNDR